MRHVMLESSFLIEKGILISHIPTFIILVVEIRVLVNNADEL